MCWHEIEAGVYERPGPVAGGRYIIEHLPECYEGPRWSLRYEGGVSALIDRFDTLGAAQRHVDGFFGSSGSSGSSGYERYERFAQWLWYDLRPLWLSLMAAMAGVFLGLALTHC
jgi:hypothetical protein